MRFSLLSLVFGLLLVRPLLRVLEVPRATTFHDVLRAGADIGVTSGRAVLGAVAGGGVVGTGTPATHIGNGFSSPSNSALAHSDWPSVIDGMA